MKHVLHCGKCSGMYMEVSCSLLVGGADSMMCQDTGAKHSLLGLFELLFSSPCTTVSGLVDADVTAVT